MQGFFFFEGLATALNASSVSGPECNPKTTICSCHRPVFRLVMRVCAFVDILPKYYRFTSFYLFVCLVS